MLVIVFANVYLYGFLQTHIFRFYRHFSKINVDSVLFSFFIVDALAGTQDLFMASGDLLAGFAKSDTWRKIALSNPVYPLSLNARNLG